MEKKFIDFYDILGIPHHCPASIIYLSILKLESMNFEEIYQEAVQIQVVKSMISQAKEKLFSSVPNREEYEHEWQAYYYPLEDEKTNITQFLIRSANSKMLSNGFRSKQLPFKTYEINDVFQYHKDFFYFIVRDLEDKRSVFFLEPDREVSLPPLEDVLVFEQKNFYLLSKGNSEIKISNDAIGKKIFISKKECKIPIHIGDRIQFKNGTRLIFKSIYSYKNSPVKSAKNYTLYFMQEDAFVHLENDKVYIVGRNTSDINDLSLDEDKFCCVNVGRRERSISRQNFQVFNHQGIWYIQDLGSRYGTTLDYKSHNKLETLAGGNFMELEEGVIRMGYNKTYRIEIFETEKLNVAEIQARRYKQKQAPQANQSVSLYNTAFV